MNNIKLIIKFSYLALLVVSCNEEPSHKMSQKTEVIDSVKQIESPVAYFIKDSTFNELINLAPSKSIPYIDSTNFDSNINSDYLDLAEIDVLQLKQIQDEFGYCEHISLAHNLNISANFKTIVVVLQSENELKTILVNYNLDGELIDFIEIAYDEMAEGWSRKTGEIHSTKIVITYILWLEEKQETITEYKILNSGKIELNLEKFRSTIRPDEMISIHKHYKDIIEFDLYNDNYDYMYLIGKKENSEVSFIYNWQHDIDKYNFNKGDLIEIEWVIDSIWIAGEDDRLEYFEWVLNAKIIKEGKTTSFLKSYTKPITYTHSDIEYTDTYLGYLNKVVEFYLANSEQELIISHIEDPNSEFRYSIEEIERNGESYKVLGISNLHDNNLSILQWMYLNIETEILYEYDLINDKLIKFENF